MAGASSVSTSCTQLLSTVERPNWAVVMAGGRGSRLGDLTDHVPKPMLLVAGRPILERIVLHWSDPGYAAFSCQWATSAS